MSETNYDIFTIMSRIEGMSNQFTKTDWKIVQFIKHHTTEFIEYSAQDLASNIGISDASIIRFAQKVGFSGLNEFKYTMQKELSKGSSSVNHSDYSALLHDYKVLADTLFKFTNPNDIDNLRSQMLSAKRIFIVGMDFNKSVAEMLAHKFALLGLTVQALTTYDILKIYCSISLPDDLFIIITLSGNHKVLSSLIGCLVQNDSNIVLISNYEKSLCAAYANLTLLIPKTDLLQCSDSISREIFIIMLFDMIFQSFLYGDSKSSQSFHKAASFSSINDDNTLNRLDKIKDLF